MMPTRGGVNLHKKCCGLLCTEAIEQVALPELLQPFPKHHDASSERRGRPPVTSLGKEMPRKF